MKSRWLLLVAIAAIGAAALGGKVLATPATTPGFSGTTLAKQLPTNVDSWPIPPTWIKGGTKFSLVCTAGGVKQSADTVLAVV